MRKALYLGLCLLVFSIASGQTFYQTHTLYVYSFAKFVQWPEENRVGDFEIAVLGDSPILPELDKLAQKKKIGDRTIRIVRLTSVKEFKKSHILFLPAAQSGALSDFVQKIGDQSTLIVTEQAGLGTKGSDINFLVKDGKLVFELNQNSLSKHKLKAANELTRLAIII
ncbi:MAG: YfiR family protein [Cyclobacteriaceae bacterium]|nr:YfiR family protein [Cyclobacteriaceae bacterium]